MTLQLPYVDLIEDERLRAIFETIQREWPATAATAGADNAYVELDVGATYAAGTFAIGSALPGTRQHRTLTVSDELTASDAMSAYLLQTSGADVEFQADIFVTFIDGATTGRERLKISAGGPLDDGIVVPSQDSPTTQIEWVHDSGGTLLDLTDPQNPTAIAAGVYIVAFVLNLPI